MSIKRQKGTIMTPLQKATQKRNFNKFRIRGAIANLQIMLSDPLLHPKEKDELITAFQALEKCIEIWKPTLPVKRK